MRVSDKAPEITSRPFHLSLGVRFFGSVWKKIKKKRQRDWEEKGEKKGKPLGALSQKGFPASKILRSRAQRNNQGFETLALTLTRFLSSASSVSKFLFFPSSSHFLKHAAEVCNGQPAASRIQKEPHLDLLQREVKENG